MSRFEEVVIKDDVTGTLAAVEDNDGQGCLSTCVQDQATPPVDLFYTQTIGSPTALTNNVAVDDRSFDVDSVASISIGNYLGIFSGTSAEGRFYFGEVLGVAGTTVTVDTPLDFAFESGDPVISSTRDLNVNGSVTPQTFSVVNGTVSSVLTIDITRMLLTMTHSSSGDDGKFGNIAGSSVINGLVFRRTNGDTRNVFNVKTNGDFRTLAFDVTYPLRSGGGGDYGTGIRYTFAGPDKHGVALRLFPGDSLDLIVQDDFSTLGGFRAVAGGHIRTVTPTP